MGSQGQDDLLQRERQRSAQQPSPVLRSASGVNQMDTTPSSSTTPAKTWIPAGPRTGGDRRPVRRAGA